MDHEDDPTPPPLPPRRNTDSIPEIYGASAQTHFEGVFEVKPHPPTPQGLKREPVSLYICKCPGTADLLLTPLKPASVGITGFDVKSGAYLLKHDDPEVFEESVEDFNRSKSDLPINARKRQSRPVESILADVSNSKQRSPEATTLEKFFAEHQAEIEAGSSPSSRRGIVQLGENLQQLLHPRGSAIANAKEMRNVHQMPLAARGLVSSGARPMTLHRIGFLLNQSTEIGEVAHLLDNTPHTRNRSQSEDDPDLETGMYIDMLEESYDPFGTDVNYISPSWIKTLTRRIQRQRAPIEDNFVFLSPWQGQCILVPSKIRQVITCYHIHPTDPETRIPVSELRLNIFPTPPRRHRKQSSADLSEPLEPPPPIRRNSGSAASSDVRNSSDEGSITTTTTHPYPSGASHPSTSSVFRKPLPLPTTDQAPALPSAPFAVGPRAGRDRSISNTDERHSKRGSVFGALRQRLGDTNSHVHNRSPSPIQSPTDRMDLSLGQERLGGGLRGRDAKLAKLVVFDEGQHFLDLVVAANMLMFKRAMRSAGWDKGWDAAAGA